MGEERGRGSEAAITGTRTRRVDCGLLSSPCPPLKSARLTPVTPEKEQAEPLVDGRGKQLAAAKSVRLPSQVLG